jgi:hypothetical protein
MRQPGRPFFLAVLLAAASTTALFAQRSTTTTGRVVRVVNGDTVPVTGVRLVLHRVGRSLQGPVDSTAADPAGRFRFRVPVDTTSLFLVSTNYAGIEYFTPPVLSTAGQGDTTVVLVVSDTSSSAPVKLTARYLVIRAAAEDGSRAVLDLLVLVNGGDHTRVGKDTLTPTWIGSLPAGAVGARVGEADFSSDAAVIRGDSLLVYAPLAPGEKQVTLEYVLPARTDLSLRFPADSVATNVLAQDADAHVINPAMALVDTQTIEGESFRRWVGVPREGSLLNVSVGLAPGQAPSWLRPALVGLVGAGLLFALWRLRARRAPASIDSLTDRIAALEARYQGREPDVTPEEWQRYVAERDRLRAELDRHLAATRAGA